MANLDSNEKLKVPYGIKLLPHIVDLVFTYLLLIENIIAKFKFLFDIIAVNELDCLPNFVQYNKMYK